MRRAALGAAVASLVLLSACSAGTTSGSQTSQDSSPASSAAVTGPAEMEHVHNITLEGDALLLGSHEGLWRQEPGKTPQRVSEPFDVMAFALAQGRYLASGHPAAGSRQPGDLGLIQSMDRGRTWTLVSLKGQADFHRLVTAQATVMGVTSADGTLRSSTDGGATWTLVGAGPYDLALDPKEPERVLATTANGPEISTNGGTNFAPIPGAPLLALVAWKGESLVGAAPDGGIHTSADAGKTWTRVGEVPGQPAGLSVAGATVVVLADSTVWQSTDGGKTFTARITGVAGH